MLNLSLSNSQTNLRLAIFKSGDNRIYGQLDKQKRFIDKNILSPKVLCATNNGFYMQYIDGVPFSQYIIQENPNIKKVENIFDKVLINIQDNLQKSSIIDIKIFKQKIIDKLQSLYYQQYRNAIYYNLVHKILQQMENLKEKVLMGECHGDLTLANMLYGKDNNLYYIDFLPIFFESPIQDIIKIRQDTQFYWSAHLLKNTNNHHIFEFLDRKIVKQFNTYIHTHFYKILEIMNYMRILPYTRTKETYQYIQTVLDKLSKDLY